MRIFILGCPRSGTSIVSTALWNLGVDMGIGNLLYKDGYFKCEDLKMATINAKILRRSGIKSDEAKLDDYKKVRVIDFEPMIKKYIKQRDDRSKVWAVKDTRLAPLFPIWQKYLGDVKVIACYRNPHYVESTTVKRENKRFVGFKMACNYEKILDSIDEKIDVEFDDIKNNPRVVLTGIINDLGLEPTEKEFERAINFIY